MAGWGQKMINRLIHNAAVACSSLMLGCLAWGADLSQADWQIEPIDSNGSISINYDINVAVAHGGVKINLTDPSLGGGSIQADRVTIDMDTQEVLAEGNVTLHQSGVAWRGERLEYNLVTKRIGTGSYRAGQSPFIASGTELAMDPETGSYRIGNAFVSTDDNENPAIKVKTGSLEVINQERFVAKNATVYAGKVPVFYLPYLSGSMNGGGSQFNTTPGYRSRYGAYLLNEYNWQMSEDLSTTFKLDYRTLRGLAGGADVDYQLSPEFGAGTIQSYYLDDSRPGIDPRGNPVTNDRFRLGWFHLANLSTNLTARVSIQKMSDPLLNRDFFESFHRQNTQPRSYLELSQQWSNFALSILTQPQVNSFQNRVERLPEIKFTGLRQQIGATPLFYESQTSVGYFAREFRYGNQPSFEAARLDSFHQILYPKTYFGWLNLTPRIGGRYGYYSETSGTGTTFTDETRFVLNTGAEVSTKVSRVYPQYESSLFDADGLRHIITPSVNYVFVPEPNARPLSLPQFDYEIPSLRMLPIDFPAFNAIDAIDTRNVMRMGMRHQLQTKRGTEALVENLLDWNVFADWRLNPDPGQEDFADMTSDLKFRPRSWLNLGSQVRYSLEDGDTRVADQNITLLPNNIWSFRLGHIYIRDEPAYWGTGNNAFYTRAYYRLNENWGARINHQYEATDGRLEEHSYTVYRDFRSFTSAFSLRFRNPRGTQDNDFTLALILSMKAFPNVKLGEDSNQTAHLFDGR